MSIGNYLIEALVAGSLAAYTALPRYSPAPQWILWGMRGSWGGASVAALLGAAASYKASLGGAHLSMLLLLVCSASGVFFSAMMLRRFFARARGRKDRDKGPHPSS